MATKRISALTLTATEADLVAGNHMVVDTPSGTKRLPADKVMANPTTTEPDISVVNLVAKDKTTGESVGVDGNVVAKSSDVAYTTFTNRDIGNKFIRECFIKDGSQVGNVTSLEVEKVKPYQTTKFRTLVRFKYGTNLFIYLFYKVYDSLEEGLLDLNPIISYSNNTNIGVVDWNVITGNSLILNLSLKSECTKIEYSPSIKLYLENPKIDSAFSTSQENAEKIAANGLRIQSVENNISIVSNNDSINAFIKELYFDDKSYVPVSVEVDKGRLSSGVYRNMIRFRDAAGVLKSAIYETGYLSETAALSALHSLYATDGIYILVDWSKFQASSGVFYGEFPFSHDTEKNNILTLLYQLKDDKKIIVEDGVSYVDEDVQEAKINTSGSYPLPYPIDDEKSVGVFVNGIKKTFGKDYDVNKNHKFIRFSDGSTPEFVNFHYSSKFKKLSHKERLDDFGLTDGETFDNAYAFKNYKIQFGEFGKGDKQWAEMIYDPSGTENKVLAFVAKAGAVDGSNTRVQIYTSDVLDFYEIESSVDMYLPSAFGWNILKNYSAHQLTFMTINELWGPLDTNVSLNPSYKTSLNIKNASDGNLYLYLNCQDRVTINGSVVSHQYNRSNGYNLSFDDSVEKKFPIPLDKWFTLKIFAKSGYNGWYKAVAVADGVETVVYDGPIMGTCPFLLSQTYEDTPFGVKYSMIHPLKMYFGDATMQYIQNNNQELRIYWRNLEYAAKVYNK